VKTTEKQGVFDQADLGSEGGAEEKSGINR
jgi:hypothetical protein